MDNNKYNNGKIYKLINTKDKKIYVGSTCNSLQFRKKGHISASLQDPDRRVYAHLNSIGWENVKIISIEKYPCESLQQLFQRERYYIESLKAELNTVIPYRSEEEKKTLRQAYEALEDTKYRLSTIYF